MRNGALPCHTDCPRDASNSRSPKRKKYSRSRSPGMCCQCLWIGLLFMGAKGESFASDAEHGTQLSTCSALSHWQTMQISDHQALPLPLMRPRCQLVRSGSWAVVQVFSQRVRAAWGVHSACLAMHQRNKIKMGSHSHDTQRRCNLVVASGPRKRRLLAIILICTHCYVAELTRVSCAGWEGGVTQRLSTANLGVP